MILPAGIRCFQLTEDSKCRLFGSKDRPAVCGSLRPSEEMCGTTDRDAFDYLEELERLTEVV